MLDLNNFNSTLLLVQTNGQQLQSQIHELSVYALHTVNVGKTVGKDSPIQRLWNVLSTLKGLNRQAWISWCNAHGSLRFVPKRDKTLLIKYQDKSKNNPKWDAAEQVELAQAIPFWEHCKEIKPNENAYNVAHALKNILTCANRAAQGGAKGDKPIRKIEHQELLDAINMLLTDPTALQKLGLEKVSGNNREALKVAA